MNRMNEYAKSLGDVLRTFDTDRMRAFIHTHAGVYPPEYVKSFETKDDEFVSGMMAKMVMNRVDMSDEDRQKAKEILKKMGWDEKIWQKQYW